jgi:hypothetical protein
MKSAKVHNMKREPFDEAMLKIALKPPEKGGLLLGPIGISPHFSPRLMLQ